MSFLSVRSASTSVLKLIKRSFCRTFLFLDDREKKYLNWVHTQFGNTHMHNYKKKKTIPRRIAD